MRKKLLTILFAVLISTGAITQVCGGDFVNDSVPVFLDSHSVRSSLNYIIPVVIQVTHLGEQVGVGTNISDEQIYSQIDQTNQDFLNNGVDTQWCLQEIRRVDGRVLAEYEEHGMELPGGGTQGASRSAVYALTERDPDNVYHVYIVSEIGGNNAGNGVQAFAYFPNSSDAARGTVQLYNTFGVDCTVFPDLKCFLDDGAVFTHEQGHSLFLYHTFQGNTCSETDCENQGDLICDTEPHPQTCSPTACGGVIPASNYMSYCFGGQTDFTPLQVDRMRLAIEAYNVPTIDDCNNCGYIDNPPVGLAKSQAPVPFPNGDIDRVQLKWYKATPDFKYQVEDSSRVDIEFWPIRDLITDTLYQNPDTSLLADKSKPMVDFFKWPVKFIRSDIQPNTRYRWRVRVKCKQEDSPWSEVKIFNTPNFDPITGVYTPPPTIEAPINGSIQEGFNKLGQRK